MKKNFLFIFVAALALCAPQLSQAQATKDTKEANKLARDGAEASKNQEWEKAVDLLRKATALDHKYAPNLAAVYQQRAYAAATNQQFQDAINDYGLCGARVRAGEVLGEAAGRGGSGVALMDCSVSKRFLRLIAS